MAVVNSLRTFSHVDDGAGTSRGKRLPQQQFKLKYEHEHMIRFFLSTLKIAPVIPHRERSPKSAIRKRTSADAQWIENSEKRVRFAPGTSNRTMKPRPKIKRKAVMKLAQEAQEGRKKKKTWRRFSWLAKLLSLFKRTRVEIWFFLPASLALYIRQETTIFSSCTYMDVVYS